MYTKGELTVRERLINCDTHFDNDQIEAVMRVLDDSGYSDMYEALKQIRSDLATDYATTILTTTQDMISQALSKAEGK